jgi:hypothetical protein
MKLKMAAFRAWHGTFAGTPIASVSWWREAKWAAELAVNANSLEGAERVLAGEGWGAPREAARSLRRKFCG